jgi:phosphoglycerate dehydrogenase-like enzyme
MRIVVTSPSFSKNEVLREEILKYFPETTFNEKGLKLTGRDLIQFIKDADGVVIGLERIDEAIMRECPKLRIIAKYGVGLDNIDTEQCAKKGISLGWTSGVNRKSVAEMTVGLMIILLRNIYITSSQLKSGVWNKNGGSDLNGKTIGIIGVGNIGKELVRLLNPFKCRILLNDIIDQTEYYNNNELIETSKENIFSNSDIVTIHTPLTEETQYMINRNTLSMMKKSAFLINTARGAIVKTYDLKWALKNNIIAGAALDVYDEEPPTDKEFLSLPNLICTPHMGGNSYESVLTMGRSAIKHLRDYFKK